MRTSLILGSALLVVVVLALFASFASADIPVHCLRDQVLGSWTYYLGDSVYSNLEAYSKCLNFNTGKSVRKLRLQISDPNVVINLDSGSSGFWSFVYDEGIEIVLDNKKYFAYFKYEVDKNGNVTSYCGQTSPGWFHDSPQYPGDTPRNWGCYLAIKDVQPRAASYSLHSEELLAIQQSRVMMKTKYQPETEMARIINSAKMTWHASDYRQLFKDQTVEQLFRQSGKSMPPIKRQDLHKFKVSMPNKDPVHQQRMSTMVPTDQLPTNWDWRSINGVDFVSPVRNQLHCGSCYTFGTLGMLEARINIISKFQRPMILSPQSVVSCSFYSQGCDGGFGYLVGKWGEDFGILSETCFPYASGNGTTPPCSDGCQITPSNVHTMMIKSTDYYYVGGFFGACNEAAMMQELYSRGPVAVSFLVTPEFRLYKGGIFRHNAQLDEQLRHASVNPWPWEETNHLVLLVGWGLDTTTNTKYWIVKNSWGTEWGENGYFRIVRGVDELAIESMAESAMPVLL